MGKGEYLKYVYWSSSLSLCIYLSFPFNCCIFNLSLLVTMFVSRFLLLLLLKKCAYRQVFLVACNSMFYGRDRPRDLLCGKLRCQTCGTLALAKNVLAAVDINHPISLLLAPWLWNRQSHWEVISSLFSQNRRWLLRPVLSSRSYVLVKLYGFPPAPWTILEKSFINDF